MAPQTHQISVIVLAAGKGTRMKSRRPKVLHEMAGLSLLGHVLKTADSVGAGELVVVVGPGMEDVAAEAQRWSPEVKIAIQERQAGTGDAVAAALPFLALADGDVVILYGDTPLVRPETIRTMLMARSEGAALATLTFRPADCAGYGRMIVQENGSGQLHVERIVEALDASSEERAVPWCNSGIYVVPTELLRALVPKIGNDNAKAEYYLTDIVALARQEGKSVVAIEGEPDEVLGVNSREDLAAAETVYQVRARKDAMIAGASLYDPSTVYFSHDTRLGRDVAVGPNVFFAPNVRVEDGVEIRAFCHLEGTWVKSGATVGPFARLRPGTVIESSAHIGNFVETKKAVIGAGAKINHLTYIGDARIGAKANIGAGTITCNYDGFDKHLTEIGAGAFVGSNSSLVAPISIGDGAYIGSGSVITQDVPADALSLARADQVSREGWAASFRARKEEEKQRRADQKE